MGISPLWAQDASTQELSFVYIAHDENTDTQGLVRRLKEQYENTLYYPELRATIFYLANGNNPIIVNVNTKNDNREDFKNLISSLQSQRSHDINSIEDVERILQLLESNDIITDDGDFVYKTVTWTYYINSSFWVLRNNEDIIAKLYFILDMEQLISLNYLTLNIYYSEQTDEIRYNHLRPFGSKNLCRLLDFALIPY